jgi:hypothetical protein
VGSGQATLVHRAPALTEDALRVPPTSNVHFAKAADGRAELEEAFQVYVQDKVQA